MTELQRGTGQSEHFKDCQAMPVSAARHAHMSANARLFRRAVDDEVVSLGLAGDGFLDRGVERLVALA